MLSPNKLNGYPVQAAIRAELTGSDTATALGLVAVSSSPVLALCRALLEAGHDAGTLMTCWRGDVLCLRIRSIGDVADLEINGHGNGFKPRHGGGPGPPIDFAGLRIGDSPPTTPNAPAHEVAR
jgi:hypothetical protein